MELDVEKMIEEKLPTARIRAWNDRFYKATEKEKVEILCDELTRTQMELLTLRAEFEMVNARRKF